MQYLRGNTFDQVTKDYQTASSAPKVAVSKLENESGQLLIEPMAKQLTVWFDLPMNTATLNNASIVIKDSEGNAVPSAVTAKSEYCCLIVPESALQENAEYTLELSSAVQDGFGNSLPDKRIAFATAGHFFETTDFAASQADGSPLSYLGDGGVRFELCLLNGGTQQEEVSLFMAFYAKNGSLLEVCRVQKHIAAGATETLTVQNDTVPTGTESMKLFAWSRFRPMQMVREMKIK